MLVGDDPDATLATPYLEVRARVVGITGTPDPRYHARVSPDRFGLPWPRRPRDADLVIVTKPGDSPDILAAIASSLDAGGVGVLAVPASAAYPSARVHAAGLELRRRQRATTAEGRFDILVVADPRPARRLPSEGPDLDRTACVDRSAVLAALARRPWAGPEPSRPPRSTEALLTALRQQLASGEPDVRTLPWPRRRHDTLAVPGCDVLAVMPHPDDESVYAGGTLAGLSASGRRVHLVVATNGAGGRGGRDLAPRRAHELLTAARDLGLVGLHCLAWADFGKYRDDARTEPVRAGDAIRTWGLMPCLLQLVREIRRARPLRLLGLDPEVDPNLSLHGHHLGLGVLLAVAFHAAADPGFAPQLGPAWSCAEHRVMSPRAHARWGDAFEIDRVAKRRALRAHASQAYSTASLLRSLEDLERPAVEVSRRLQHRRPLEWTLVRTTPAPASSIDWETAARRVPAVARPRGAVVEALERQSGPHPLDAAARESLAMLARDDSVAVVTGQQVGLLGGPVYTLAKALGAVALARRLRARGLPAVPVFWMASQDHDLAEVQQVARLDGDPLTLGLVPDGGPVGSRALGPGITELLDRWENDLPLPASEVIAMLRRIHRPDHDLAGAFASLLREVTRGTGLLVLDPSDPELTRRVGPLLQRALRETDAVHEALEQARERMGGRATIPSRHDQTQVFALDADGVRTRIARPTDDDAMRDAVQTVERSPERASAAALLRPLVQDTLLPTIAYVAGPTERRYLAQLDELYAWAQLPSPTVVARPSLHLVSTHDAEALRSAGGVDRLRASARPLELIGRAGLGDTGLAWLDAVETLLRRLPAPGAKLPAPMDLREAILAFDRHATSIELEGRGLRIQRTWGYARERLHQRLEQLERSPSTHHVTRLRHALGRLRRSLLRDGRRARPTAIAAWRRVGSAPCAPERRMTVAEWLVRSAPYSPHAVLDALDARDCAELSLLVGGAR